MEDPVVRLKRLKMAAHRAALQSHIPRTQLLSAAIHISAGPENRFSFHFHCTLCSNLSFLVLLTSNQHRN